MTKIQLSKLLSAVDNFYKKAQDTRHGRSSERIQNVIPTNSKTPGISNFTDLSKLLSVTPTQISSKPEVQTPKFWGSAEQQTMVIAIQKFLMNTVGPSALGATGADGKWGPKSETALRTWLLYNGKKGSGKLDMAALEALASHIPEVDAYYQKEFGLSATRK